MAAVAAVTSLIESTEDTFTQSQSGTGLVVLLRQNVLVF